MHSNCALKLNEFQSNTAARYPAEAKRVTEREREKDGKWKEIGGKGERISGRQLKKWKINDDKEEDFQRVKQNEATDDKDNEEVTKVTMCIEHAKSIFRANDNYFKFRSGKL